MTCVVADAVDDSDLTVLGQAVQSVPVPILPIGTPAFAAELARIRYAGAGWSGATWLPGSVQPPAVRPHPVLVVNASLESRTVRALETLTGKARMASTSLECSLLGADEGGYPEVRALAQGLLAGLDGALTVTASVGEAERGRRLADDLGLSTQERDRRLLDTLMGRLRFLLDRVPDVHLVLVGSPLAAAVIDLLGPTHLEVRGELPSGVPVLGIPRDPRGLVVWMEDSPPGADLVSVVDGLHALLTRSSFR